MSNEVIHEKLKACPFCGSDSARVVRENRTLLWYVECVECTTPGYCGSPEAAIKKWNDRKDKDFVGRFMDENEELFKDLQKLEEQEQKTFKFKEPLGSILCNTCKTTNYIYSEHLNESKKED